jgi:cytochrome c553
MSGMSATIKDSDIDALADYFSKMKPALGTLSRPFSILTAGR